MLPIRSVLLSLSAALAVAPLAIDAQGTPGSNAPTYAIIDSMNAGHVPDGSGVYDLDVVNRRLYGAGNAIIDIDAKAVVGHIRDSTPGVQYFVAAEAGRGLASDGTIFNPATGLVGEHLPARGTAIVYDPGTRRAFLLGDTLSVVSLAYSMPSMMMRQGRMGGGGSGREPGRGGEGTAGGDPNDPTRTASNPSRDSMFRRFMTVPLTAHTVGHVAVPGAGDAGVADARSRLYVLRPEVDSIAVIDADKLRVLGSRGVEGCTKPKALSIDNVHQQLLVGCDGQAVALSLLDGRVVSQIPIHGQPRQLAYDPGPQLLFIPAGDQGIVIAHQTSPGHFTVVQTLTDPRLAGAESAILDPTTHTVLVPIRDSDGTLRFTMLGPAM